MTASPPDDSAMDLCWMPVGAGTRVQRWSLDLYESLTATLARRQRAGFYHSALKIRLDGVPHTLEVKPMSAHQPKPPLMTGPVGVRGADRFRAFRYQLYYSDDESLPDEQWAVGAPRRLTDDPDLIRRLLDLGPSVPRHTWGQRAKGTREMWTSDSVISWLLCRVGIDASAIMPPADGRAPGWISGIEHAGHAGRD